MVRTRANPAAARKAVAAKAPRKTLVSASPSSVSPTSNNKKKPGCGGNPLKLWPKPSWQKGLMAFMSSGAAGGSGESSGCSSSSSDNTTTVCEIEKDVILDTEDTQNTTDMEGAGGSSSSNNSTQLLAGLGDVAQLNSDSEED